MTGKRVFAQNLIGKGRQAVEALPHIRDQQCPVVWCNFRW
jgi:hypothetical protein